MLDIVESIQLFLSNITEDRENNDYLYNNYLAKWGKAVVPLSFSIIVDRLRTLSDSTKYSFMDNEVMGDNYIHHVGMVCLSGLEDAIIKMGDCGYQCLLSTIHSSRNEIVELGALVLGIAELAKPEAIPLLREAYNQAVAKNLCNVKIALAVALLAHGDTRPLKESMLPLSRDPQHLTKTIRNLQKGMPDMDEDLMESALLQQSTSFAASRLIILDIATRGAYSHHAFSS